MPFLGFIVMGFSKGKGIAFHIRSDVNESLKMRLKGKTNNHKFSVFHPVLSVPRGEKVS